MNFVIHFLRTILSFYVSIDAVTIHPVQKVIPPLPVLKRNIMFGNGNYGLLLAPPFLLSNIYLFILLCVIEILYTMKIKFNYFVASCITMKTCFCYKGTLSTIHAHSLCVEYPHAR